MIQEEEGISPCELPYPPILAKCGGSFNCGIHVIDGVTNKRSSRRDIHRGPRVLVPGRSHVIRCSVRKGGVVVTIDGKLMFNWKGDLKRLATTRDYRMPRKDLLFLGSWEASFKISRVELTAVSGKGRPLR